VLITGQGSISNFNINQTNYGVPANYNTQSLSWTGSIGATSYNIYRNGVLYANVTAQTQFSGYISGNTLTVTSIASGSISAITRYQAPGIAAGTCICCNDQNSDNSPLLSGTLGGVGTYYVNNSQTLGSSGSPVTFTAWEYIDTEATNSNACNLFQPATPYAYAVTAVNSNGESAKAYPRVYLYQSGVSNQSESDDSYGLASENWTSTANVQSGSIAAIQLNFDAGGGFQPISQSSLVPAFDLELGGGFEYLTVDVYQTESPGASFTASMISRPGSNAGSDVFPFSTVVLINADGTSDYGTLAVGSWGTLKVPLADFTIGVSTFYGYISGTTLTMTSLVSGGGPDAGGYITGAGVTAGTYINTQPGSLSGPFTLNNSMTVGSSGSPVLLTCQRTDFYKFGFYPTGEPDVPGLTYLDNLGWTTD
jgi:hypothetical protein